MSIEVLACGVTVAVYCLLLFQVMMLLWSHVWLETIPCPFYTMEGSDNPLVFANIVYAYNGFVHTVHLCSVS